MKTIQNKEMYINREVSWIQFNGRVLDQCQRKEIPLLERLNFLGITANNLDEFIMIRFGSIINKLTYNLNKPELTNLTPLNEFKLIYNLILDFKNKQEIIYNNLINELSQQKISLVKFKGLTNEEKKYIGKIFEESIYPLINPIIYDTTNEFPTLTSKQLNIVIGLEDNDTENIAIISLNDSLNRLYEIKSSDDTKKYILLEDIINEYLKKIFINKKIIYSGTMRVLRNADIEISDNYDRFIVERMKESLIKRRDNDILFLEVENNISKNILKILKKSLNIKKNFIISNKRVLDLKFLSNRLIRDSKLEYPKFIPQYPEDLLGEQDMFKAIEEDDILLHHPYESFMPVIKFIENASMDKDVLSIRQTLYRVSSIDSPIVNALCNAALNGKEVIVLLEIKARFDEDKNLSLIHKLKESGCKLIYGVEELKTHCKMSVIIKKVKNNLKIYSHIGTGNYNDKTSKIYTDISYFTCKEKIGYDLITIFNSLSGFSSPKKEIEKVYFSPYNIRTKLNEMIDNEINNVKKGEKGNIIIKCNSLSDKDIIDKLYQASNVGVKIILIVRGVCSIKPINENITIKSIVGRQLEHSRIYYFYNNNKNNIYISSADMLTRNLDRRVELMVELYNSVKNKLLRILFKYLEDSYNSYIMNKEGIYYKVNEKKSFNIHNYFMDKAISSNKLKHIPKITMKE